MKNISKLNLPHDYTALNSDEAARVNGGCTSGIISLISYLLGGLDLSFGSNQSNVSTDTTGVASKATVTSVSTSTGTTASGRGGKATSSSVTSVATHANVNTGTQGNYVKWDANFNLGELFTHILGAFI